MISKEFLSEHLPPPTLQLVAVTESLPVIEAIKKAATAGTKYLLVENKEGEISGVVKLDTLLCNLDKLATMQIEDYLDKNFLVVSSEGVSRIVSGKLENRYVIIKKNQTYGGIIDLTVENKHSKIHKNVEHLINLILDSSQNGILAVDTEKNVVIINRKAAEFYHVREQDVINKKLDEALPYSKLNEIDLLQSSATAIKYEMDGRNIVAHRGPMNLGGKVRAVISVFQDITELEEASEKLSLVQKSEESLKNIIESSYDGIYITDKNGKTLIVNQAYERISGIPKQEFLGKYMNELVESGILSLCVTDDVVASKAPVTYTQTIQNGKRVVITGSPILGKDGRVDGVITNVRDITEIIKLEKQLILSKERMHLYQKELFKDFNQDDLICTSKKFQAVLNLAAKVSKMDSTVLILGETGSGKEIVAQYIHKHSHRVEAPYIKVNCGALPANLLESELFGYVAGAFTGASSKGKLGMFELADGGTLFLDEIGELPLELQPALLRVLQDGEVTRLGDSKSRKVDVRIVTATNRNLEEMILKGSFRQDLFYRLNVVAIHVPSLRERLDDIPSLAEKAIRQLNEKYNHKKVISSNFINALLTRDWPGNVRELNNFIEKQFVLSDDDVLDGFAERTSAELEVQIAGSSEDRISVRGIMPLAEAKREVETILIGRAIKQGKSTHKAASLLNMSQPTFFRKYKELYPDGKAQDEETV